MQQVDAALRKAGDLHVLGRRVADRLVTGVGELPHAVDLVDDVPPGVVAREGLEEVVLQDDGDVVGGRAVVAHHVADGLDLVLVRVAGRRDVLEARRGVDVDLVGRCGVACVSGERRPGGDVGFLGLRRATEVDGDLSVERAAGVGDRRLVVAGAVAVLCGVLLAGRALGRAVALVAVAALAGGDGDGGRTDGDGDEQTPKHGVAQSKLPHVSWTHPVSAYQYTLFFSNRYSLLSVKLHITRFDIANTVIEHDGVVRVGTMENLMIVWLTGINRRIVKIVSRRVLI